MMTVRAGKKKVRGGFYVSKYVFTRWERLRMRLSGELPCGCYWSRAAYVCAEGCERHGE